MTAAKGAENALAHETLHDALTGLANRTLLNDRLDLALLRTERRPGLVAVAFVDLDHFKRINDSLGHAAGDELLVAAAERLARSLRTGDTLARFAGDEFVVVWPDVDSVEEAQHLAERMNEAFSTPFSILGETVTVNVTASVGLATGSYPQTGEDLLLAVDAAMYDAKHRGRGRIRTYTEEMRSGVEQRLRTEGEISAGIAHGEFVLHYQPIMDLRRREVTGVEALVRWAHPDGLRMPDSFLPIAEQSGLIVPLGAWVLAEACQQARRWFDEGLDLQMSVNLSARQLSHPDLLSQVDEALTRSALPPSRLVVEVTQGVLVDEEDTAQDFLNTLVSLGTKLAIDNFGTGYSSLHHLKRYPISQLKIDRSYVAGMGLRDEDDAVVASAIGLARAFGALCVAEGVETREQHGALLALGCRMAQGYLFGRPGPP